MFLKSETAPDTGNGNDSEKSEKSGNTIGDVSSNTQKHFKHVKSYDIFVFCFRVLVKVWVPFSTTMMQLHLTLATPHLMILQ